MSMQNTKCHNYVHIAALLILAVLGIFLSPNANALSTTVRNVSGMTLGATSINAGVRLLNVKYTRYIEAHINPSIRNGMVSHFIQDYKDICMDIAQRLILLNVPVTEITITTIRDIPELGWKTKTCKVSPVVNISVD